MNNGSCTVNQGNQPNCRCLPTFIGDRCQYRECCLSMARVAGEGQTDRSPLFWGILFGDLWGQCLRGWTPR